jgi:hypothetical protein
MSLMDKVFGLTELEEIPLTQSIKPASVLKPCKKSHVLRTNVIGAHIIEIIGWSLNQEAVSF